MALITILRTELRTDLREISPELAREYDKFTKTGSTNAATPSESTNKVPSSSNAGLALPPFTRTRFQMLSEESGELIAVCSIGLLLYVALCCLDGVMFAAKKATPTYNYSTFSSMSAAVKAESSRSSHSARAFAQSFDNVPSTTYVAAGNVVSTLKGLKDDVAERSRLHSTREIYNYSFVSGKNEYKKDKDLPWLQTSGQFLNTIPDRPHYFGSVNGYAGLSTEDDELVQLKVEGYTNKEAADILGMSLRAIERQMSSIRAKVKREENKNGVFFDRGTHFNPTSVPFLQRLFWDRTLAAAA